jgi:hypothetical protein
MLGRPSAKYCEGTNRAAPSLPVGPRSSCRKAWTGKTYSWKIDYCVLDLNGGSEDPAALERTTRVLTFMRADEC